MLAFFFLRLAFGSGRNHVAAASANANKKMCIEGKKKREKKCEATKSRESVKKTNSKRRDALFLYLLSPQSHLSTTNP